MIEETEAVAIRKIFELYTSSEIGLGGIANPVSYTHLIYDAMKLRGIALSWKNVFTRPVLILEAIAIPIVMRSASIAEELSDRKSVV